MHLAYLYLESAEKFDSPTAYANNNPLQQKLYRHLTEKSFSIISHVQRAGFDQSGTISGVRYYFVKDSFGKTLRWWQKPAPAFTLLAKMRADIIFVMGLNLPLNFRWLRRLTGEDTKIVGFHGGETIWPSRNLWLQQFGLRVVDAFIFRDSDACKPWNKASVILSRQPVYFITVQEKETQKQAAQVEKICSELAQS